MPIFASNLFLVIIFGDRQTDTQTFKLFRVDVLPCEGHRFSNIAYLSALTLISGCGCVLFCSFQVMVKVQFILLVAVKAIGILNRLEASLKQNLKIWNISKKKG